MKFDGLARRSRAARPEAEDGREESPDLLGSFCPPNLDAVAPCGMPCFWQSSGSKSQLHTTLLDINGAKTMKWLRLLDKIVPDIVVWLQIVPSYISLLLAGPTKSEQNEVV